MARSIICNLLIPILFITFFNLSAQEINKKNNYENKNAPVTKGIDSITTTGDKVTIKDGTTTLIEINSEGTAGSITIPSLSTIVTNTNKLYNMSGTLYFNGSALGSGGGASSLNDLSDAIYIGYSLFLGTGSGVNDDGTANFNTAIGYNSMYSNISGIENIATGYSALYSNTTGSDNTANGALALYSNKAGSNGVAVGYESQYYANNTTTAFDNKNTSVGYQTLRGSTTPANNTGNYNSAFGYQALSSNTSGYSNTANGYFALYSNTSGYQNTANGSSALYSNTTGYANTANGYQALYSNISGFSNTANGWEALYSNTTGSQNTANGLSALYYNKAGSGGVAVGYQSQKNVNNTTTAFTNYNTSVGYQSLMGSSTPSNNTGNYNSAFGYQALYSNTGGYQNTANGSYALYSNTSGSYNTANGYYALYHNISGSQNTAYGYSAGPGASDLVNTTAIGYNATVTANSQVRIGNSSVTSIGGYAGWTNISDIRFKKNIREDVSGLDFIMGLRPITYNLDVNAIANKLGEDMRIDKDGNRVKEQPSEEILTSRNEKAGIRQSGFSAQAVEALAEKLGYDFGGVDKPENDNGFYGLRYSEFVVPLVKAVQEQQKVIENLTKRIEVLENK